MLVTILVWNNRLAARLDRWALRKTCFKGTRCFNKTGAPSPYSECRSFPIFVGGRMSFFIKGHKPCHVAPLKKFL